MMKEKMKKLLHMTMWLLVIGITGCGGQKEYLPASTTRKGDDSVVTDSVQAINSEGATIRTRYNVPPKCHRIEGETGSFAEYLQNLPLKPLNKEDEKGKIGSGVIGLDVEPSDNQDAVGSIIRLRGEYLYSSGQYDKIRFHLNKRFIADFNQWAKGYRIVNHGSHMRWEKRGTEDDTSYDNFRAYLSAVMAVADIDALKLDLKKITEEEFGPGAVIISDDSPQHVAIVVDMIQRNDPHGWRGLPAVLLAQGGLPSQEIELIKGNGDEFGMFGNYKRSEFYRYWTTTNYGERYISRQGGLLLTGDKKFTNKHLYIFDENKITSSKK